MKKLKCEIGEKFGYWEVVDNTPIVKSGHTYIKVRCKCGKEELKCLSDLKNGRSTGCKSCKARERSRKVQIGDKYKHWTVIDGPGKNSSGSIIWLCICDCGKNKRWIQANELMNPDRCFECSECAAKRRAEKTVSNNGKVGELTLTRFTKLQKSAEKRGIYFELSMDYLWNLFERQQRKCAITGDLIESFDNASLDRINSEDGYVEGNVQWVTYQANVSKHTMTMEQLYEFCKKVLNHADQQPSLPLTKQEGSETNS